MLRTDYQSKMRKDILKASEFLANREKLDLITFIDRMATLKRTVDIAYGDLTACPYCTKEKYGKKEYLMKNNNFGDLTGPANYYLSIPVGRGNVRLHRQDQHGDETLAEIAQKTWRLLVRAVELEFNTRSKADGYLVAHFARTDNQVSREYAMELAVLMWAVETETDEETIATARRNWQTLLPEERWWWFSQARASNTALQTKGLTAEEAHARGWCRAIREGLCTAYVR